MSYDKEREDIRKELEKFPFIGCEYLDKKDIRIGGYSPDIESENYDYIELVELIDTGVDQTLSTLYQRMEQNSYYRGRRNRQAPFRA